MIGERGSRLGPYEIVDPLGAGGMGEVFRARDHRLSRDVAVKILHRDRLDSTRLRQFETEARTAGALSHPNIIVVHDVGTHEGVPYVVTELLTGQTLQQRIATGALTPRKALELAIQIADGLAAAHAKGIVHRDLKPANLFVTDEGRLKILDFGLATLRRPADQATSSDGSTRTSEPVAGTPGYMSPEQVYGLLTDSRADIFSFGVVLYEMLARRRPFPGPAPQARAAIIASDPPPLENGAALTRALWPIIKRCLEKRPSERFQSAHDLRLALCAVSETDVTHRATSARLRRWPRALVAVVVPGVMAAAFFWRPAGSGSELRFSSPRAITTFAGAEESPTLSPDGSQVAFVWNDDQPGVRNLHVKAIDAPEALALTTDGQVWTPAWSPDGQRIAFLRASVTGDYAVMVVPALGGSERRIASVSSVGGISWSPDGALLAVADKAADSGPQAIVLVSVQTGEKRQLSLPPEATDSDAAPTFSFDGRMVAYARSRPSVAGSQVLVQQIDSTKATPLLSMPTAVLDLEWIPDGSGLLLLMRGPPDQGGLWKTPLVNPQPIRLHVASEAHEIALSRSGRRLAYAEGKVDCDVWRVDGPNARARRPPRRLIASSRIDLMPGFSPDGSRIVFVSGRGGGLHLWTCSSEGRQCAQLTTTGVAVMPAWSPTGERIAFVERERNADIALLAAEGGALRRLTNDQAEDVAPAWSRDGEWVYFASNRTGEWEVWKVSVRDGSLRQITKTGGMVPHESSDGRWLYYSKPKDETIWRAKIDGSGERLATEIRVWPGYWSLWREDLIHLSFPGPAFDRHDLRTGRVRTISPLPGKTDLCVSPGTAFAISPDGESILYSKDDLHAGDVYVIDVDGTR